MALLGMKIPSMEVGGKTLRSDPKKTTANPAHKIAEQSKITHGLATPESTPSLWTARLEVDKARREAEAAKASDVGTSDSPSGVDSVNINTSIRSSWKFSLSIYRS